MITQLNQFYGVPLPQVSARIRYLALVGEVRERAMNAASCLGIDPKTVEAKVEEEYKRRHETGESNSSVEVWNWAVVEILSGRIK